MISVTINRLQTASWTNVSCSTRVLVLAARVVKAGGSKTRRALPKTKGCICSKLAWTRPVLIKWMTRFVEVGFRDCRRSFWGLGCWEASRGSWMQRSRSRIWRKALKREKKSLILTPNRRMQRESFVKLPKERKFKNWEISRRIDLMDNLKRNVK